MRASGRTNRAPSGTRQDFTADSERTAAAAVAAHVCRRQRPECPFATRVTDRNWALSPTHKCNPSLRSSCAPQTTRTYNRNASHTHTHTLTGKYIRCCCRLAIYLFIHMLIRVNDANGGGQLIVLLIAPLIASTIRIMPRCAHMSTICMCMCARVPACVSVMDSCTPY